MKMAEIIKKKIEEKGISVRRYSEEIELPYTTVLTILKRGLSKTDIDTVIKMCKGVDMKVEELIRLARAETKQPPLPFSKSKLEAAFNKAGISPNALDKLSEENQQLIAQIVKKFLDNKNNG